jgi:LmbE family N-acetylglucosaminyl deacetylase
MTDIVTTLPVAWMDVEEDGTRHGLRYWREGTHREVPLYMVPPDHREAMRLALRYMESVGQKEMFPEEWQIVIALRAALGDDK